MLLPTCCYHKSVFHTRQELPLGLILAPFVSPRRCVPYRVTGRFYRVFVFPGGSFETIRCDFRTCFRKGLSNCCFSTPLSGVYFAVHFWNRRVRRYPVSQSESFPSVLAGSSRTSHCHFPPVSRVAVAGLSSLCKHFGLQSIY